MAGSGVIRVASGKVDDAVSAAKGSNQTKLDDFTDLPTKGGDLIRLQNSGVPTGALVVGAVVLLLVVM